MADFSRMVQPQSSARYAAIGRLAQLRASLLERPPGHRRHLVQHALRGLTADGKLALALELLDRGLRLRVDDPGRLDLAVTEIGQRALERDHALGRRRRPLARLVAGDV